MFPGFVTWSVRASKERRVLGKAGTGGTRFSRCTRWSYGHTDLYLERSSVSRNKILIALRLMIDHIPPQRTLHLVRRHSISSGTCNEFVARAAHRTFWLSYCETVRTKKGSRCHHSQVCLSHICSEVLHLICTTSGSCEVEWKVNCSVQHPIQWIPHFEI